MEFLKDFGPGPRGPGTRKTLRFWRWKTDKISKKVEKWIFFLEKFPKK